MKEVNRTEHLHRILAEFRRGAALIEGEGFRVRLLLEFEWYDEKGRLYCLCAEGPAHGLDPAMAENGNRRVSIRCVNRRLQHYALLEGRLLQWDQQPLFCIRQRQKLHIMQVKIDAFHFLEGLNALQEAGNSSAGKPAADIRQEIRSSLV